MSTIVARLIYWSAVNDHVAIAADATLKASISSYAIPGGGFVQFLYAAISS